MRTATLPRGGRGFTLLEVLIALAVFAVTSAALIGAVTRHLNQSLLLSDRVVAQWVAENELNQLRIGEKRQGESERWPDTGTIRREVRMAERDWQVRVEVRATDNEDIRRVAAMVFRARDDANAEPLVELVGFIGRY